MAIDPSSLKVTELRAELSSRKLPTKGKKDELIARLKEALENENTNEAAEATSTEKPAETSEESNAAEVEAKDPVEEDTEKLVEPVEETTTAAQVTEKVEEMEVEQPVAEVTEVPKETAVVESEEQSSEKIEEKVKDAAQEETIEESKKDIIEKTEVVDDKPGPEETNSEGTTLKRKLSAEDADSSNEKRSKVDTTSTGCSALYVKGFVRPLISRNVQELFGKYGSVKRFWMDFIKTHSYVIYETEEEANNAFDNINGIVFPPDTGKTLTAGKLTTEQAEQLIEYEQTAASNHIRIEWEPLVEKVKAGETLPQSPDGSGSAVRVARSIGMGQIAKQLAQAAEPIPNAARQITITASTPVAKERSLDELFRKTETLPHLYYLPVSDEEASIKLKSIQSL